MNPIVITTGEPAGIGPEVSIRSVFEVDFPVVLLGDREFLESERLRLGLSDWPQHVQIEHVPLRAPVEHGKLDARNSAYVLDILRTAALGAMQGRYSAIATAPVQKSIINDAGFAFTGHTEFFADIAHCEKVVMMLVSSARADALRVALVTTHLPIARVAQAITAENVDRTLSILHHDLVEHFGITAPRIAVTGLNPHAGEGGHLGTEEIEIISPAIERANAAGIACKGPFPADTIFAQAQLANWDAILCMYHDQGLPVLKHASFGHGVNVTLGLPFVRTSVDHGTALDIAGRNLAHSGSMITAIDLAQTLATYKNHHG